MSTTTQPTTFARCAVEWCDRPSRGRTGACATHYEYRRKHGTLVPAAWDVVPLSLTAIESAWLAAVIDCEGTITLKKTGAVGVVRPSPTICVGNTDIRLINRLADLCGCGKIRFVRQKTLRAKDQWHWSVNRQSEVRAILLAIRDDLLLKRDQADIVLGLPPPNTKAAGLRIAAMEACHALNKKGRSE